MPPPLTGRAMAAAPATDVYMPSGGGGPGHGLDGDGGLAAAAVDVEERDGQA